MWTQEEEEAEVGEDHEEVEAADEAGRHLEEYLEDYLVARNPSRRLPLGAVTPNKPGATLAEQAMLAPATPSRLGVVETRAEQGTRAPATRSRLGAVEIQTEEEEHKEESVAEDGLTPREIPAGVMGVTVVVAVGVDG